MSQLKIPYGPALERLRDWAMADVDYERKALMMDARFVIDALDKTLARVAELEAALRLLDTEDHLQCDMPLWNEGEQDSYPCDVCSFCRARAALERKP